MKTYKTGAVVFLLAICLIAIALGYAGSRSIPEENFADGAIALNANSTGIVIPQYLITDEVNNVLSEVESKYPGCVFHDPEQVTLIGSETVDFFKDSINENNIDFDWAAVYSFYELESSVFTAGPFIAYPTTLPNSVTISYDELEKILNGDNETVSYYREILNNSKHENSSDGILYEEVGVCSGVVIGQGNFSSIHSVEIIPMSTHLSESNNE